MPQVESTNPYVRMIRKSALEEEGSFASELKMGHDSDIQSTDPAFKIDTKSPAKEKKRVSRRERHSRSRSHGKPNTMLGTDNIDLTKSQYFQDLMAE